MPGLQNIWRSGLYQGMHPIYLGNSVVSAVAYGFQPMKSGLSAVYMECSSIDTVGTPFATTTSVPMGPNVGGVTSGTGNAMVGSSALFFINGQPTNQNGTMKFLQGGNCPMASMSMPSMLRSMVIVNG